MTFDTLAMFFDDRNEIPSMLVVVVSPVCFCCLLPNNNGFLGG